MKRIRLKEDFGLDNKMMVYNSLQLFAYPSLVELRSDEITICPLDEQEEDRIKSFLKKNKVKFDLSEDSMFTIDYEDLDPALEDLLERPTSDYYFVDYENDMGDIDSIEFDSIDGAYDKAMELAEDFNINRISINDGKNYYLTAINEGESFDIQINDLLVEDFNCEDYEYEDDKVDDDFMSSYINHFDESMTVKDLKAELDNHWSGDPVMIKNGDDYYDVVEDNSDETALVLEPLDPYTGKSGLDESVNPYEDHKWVIDKIDLEDEGIDVDTINKDLTLHAYEDGDKVVIEGCENNVWNFLHRYNLQYKFSLLEELNEDYTDTDSDWGEPYTFDECEREIRKITNNYRDKEGTVKCYYVEEKNFATQILKDHYKIVEVSDGRRSHSDEVCWVIAYSRSLFDKEESKESKVVSESLNEELTYLEKECKDLYYELRNIIMDGANADIQDNIKKAFERIGGKAYIKVHSPEYLEINGIVDNSYKTKEFISLNNLDLDVKILIEDMVMAYYRTHGGEGYRTPELVKHILSESLNEDFINMDIYNELTDEEQRFIDFMDLSLDYTSDRKIRMSNYEDEWIFDSLDDLTSNLDYSIKQEKLKGSWDEIIDDFIKEDFDLSKLDQEDCYRFLARMKSDCDYFLGNGNRAEKHLWSGNVEDQIKDMRYLYNRVKEKPEWLSKEDIDNYEKRMLSKSLTEDYSDRYYKTEDKLIYRLDSIRYSQGVEKPYAELSLILVCGWDYCDTESDRMGWVDADNWVSDVQSKYIVVYLEEESINSALEYEGLEPCDRPSTIWKYDEEKDRYVKM